jgi:hypothetical protein
MATKLDKLLDEAIANIRKDREKANSLLGDVAEWIGKGQERHREVGLTAAKYLETLQRSNEQLVKIAAIMKTKINSEYGDLDNEEKDDIYNEIEDVDKDVKEQI